MVDDPKADYYIELAENTGIEIVDRPLNIPTSRGAQDGCELIKTRIGAFEAERERLCRAAPFALERAAAIPRADVEDTLGGEVGGHAGKIHRNFDWTATRRTHPREDRPALMPIDSAQKAIEVKTRRWFGQHS